MTRATRLRSKRGNPQTGQQLMAGPTRLRTKRGNREAGRVNGSGDAGEDGSVAALRCTGRLRCNGRPQLGGPSPSRILDLSALGSSGCLQRFECFLDLRRGNITMQEVAKLRERDPGRILLEDAIKLLRERDTRRVPERAHGTPSGIVPQRERRLQMLNPDRARAVQQRIDQRQPNGVRFRARGQRTPETVHRPLRHLFISSPPKAFSARIETKLTSTASMIERPRQSVLQPSVREGVLIR